MEKGSFLNEFIAGQISGFIGISFVYPLDTAKMRMQTYSGYKNSLHVVQSMIERSGYTSIYRGLASPALGFGLTFAVSFSSYGYACRAISEYKRGLQKQQTPLLISEMVLAGAFTGAMQTPVRQVVERVKSVMQVREAQAAGLGFCSSSGIGSGRSPYSWSGACVIELVRREGWRNGLFQGTSSTLLREVPQFAAYYPTYHICKKLYGEYIPDPMMLNLLAGGTAGTVQWLPPFYFLDVIKSRMQTAPQGTYAGIADCARQLYAEHGPQVFFRGLTPALARAFPLHALIFLSYEFVIEKLNGLS